jgi:hypothetical protein
MRTVTQITQKAAHLGFGNDYYTNAYIRGIEGMYPSPIIDSSPYKKEFIFADILMNSVDNHFEPSCYVLGIDAVREDYDIYLATDNCSLHGENFCLDAWAKLDAAPNDGANFIFNWYKHDHGPSLPGIALYILADLGLTAFFAGHSIHYEIGMLAVNQWNHYALSKNGAVVSLYVNGDVVGTYTYSYEENFGIESGVKDYLGARNMPLTSPSNNMYIEDWRFSKGHSRTLNLNKFPIPNRSY